MPPLAVARELDSQGAVGDRESSDTLPSGAERWWRQPPKGKCISSSEARLACFLTGESPIVKVLYKLAPSINLEAPSTTLSGIAAVKLKNPRGDSPVKL